MLTDADLRNAKPRESAYKLSDREGLYVDVRPGGAKAWRVRLKVWDAERQSMKEVLLTLGRYPKIGLAKARKLRDEAWEKVQAGINPAAEKKALKRPPAPARETTFLEAASAWHGANDHLWKPVYSNQVWGRIQSDLLPDLGKIAVASLTRADVLKALRRIEARGAHDVARKCRQHVAGILRHAGAEDERVHDFTPQLRGGLKPPPRTQHFRTLTGDDLGGVVLAIDRYKGDMTTRLALRLTLLTAARTNEICMARWSEFESLKNPSGALWRIPPERMKAKREHLVPLSAQAIDVLEKLRPITGNRDLLFPGDRGKGMSNNAMLFALYACGFHSKQTVHGFRSAFSSWANESGFNADAVERALAHDRRDVRAIYNAAQYLTQRRELLQAWADHLATIKEKASRAEIESLIG